MDTLDLYNGNTGKTTALVLNIAAIGALFVCLHLMHNTPIFAEDLKLAHTIAPTVNIGTGEKYKKFLNEISPEERGRQFDEEIRQKYPNSLIRTVTSGVKHVKMTKYYDGRPVKINVVEVNPELAKEIRQELSYIGSVIKGNAHILHSIVALNGTFFKPQTGVPLGTLMIDGKMYTGPIYDRVAMGITDNGFTMARVQLDATIKSGKNVIRIDNINQPRMLSTHVIAYTREWGVKAPASPKYGTQLAISGNKILKASANPLEIPQDGYVIVGPKVQLSKLFGADKVKVSIGTSPDWKDVNHIISGGPYLVKNGEVFVDMTAQKLGAIGGKNPRSAIGYTADGNLIMVAVDGREGRSVGMTLMQLAYFMKNAGCINAMNLDGGGSTVMYVDGQVVNNPAAKGGIAISNALVLSKKI